MRDFATCFSDYAVQVVSDTTSSCTTNTSCISPNSTPSIQNTVTSLYRSILSSKNHILITLTWTKHNNNTFSQGLTITFGDDPLTAIKLNTNSRLFRKLKGTKSLDYQSHKVEAFWDLSTARYETGPEPVDGFYLFVIIDSELGLTIGDLAEEAFLKRMKGEKCKTAKICSVSRQEYFSGNTVYSTRARFSESGSVHDILIRCSGENEGLKYPVLSVTIDKKTVIRVKRLQWNFRGNQTIFLDGLLVDLMWDVHDWFYNGSGSGSGYAVFMFRTRSGMDSRLWLEEKMVQQHKDCVNQDKVDFSLLIYACKNQNNSSS